MSFIQSIKSIDPSSILDQMRSPFLRFVSNPSKGDVIVPITSSDEVLTKAEVQELIVELQKYCDAFEDSDIESHNRKVVNYLDAKNPGYVYLIYSYNSRLYKIGYAGNPKIRCRAIASARKERLTIDHTFYCLDAVEAEAKLHEHFSAKCQHHEWFDLNEQDVKTILSISNEEDLENLLTLGEVKS